MTVPGFRCEFIHGFYCRSRRNDITNPSTRTPGGVKQSQPACEPETASRVEL
jgi:hypothetical protein